MSVKSLVVLFLLSLALSFPIVLVPLQASAVCTNPCGCNNCRMKYFTNPPCQCPGEGGCPVCRSDESDPLAVSGVAHKQLDATPIPVFFPSPISQLDVTAMVMDVIKGGTCFREKVALSLLGDSVNDLKFDLLRFDGEQLSALRRGTQN